MSDVAGHDSGPKTPPDALRTMISPNLDLVATEDLLEQLKVRFKDRGGIVMALEWKDGSDGLCRRLIHNGKVDSVERLVGAIKRHFRR